MPGKFTQNYAQNISSLIQLVAGVSETPSIVKFLEIWIGYRKTKEFKWQEVINIVDRVQNKKF